MASEGMDAPVNNSITNVMSKFLHNTIGKG